MSLEFAGKKTKSLVAIYIEIPYALGEAFAVLVAMSVNDWRDFQVIGCL